MILQQKLKQKLLASQHLYDFKVIQSQFDTSTVSQEHHNVYLNSQEMTSKIQSPLIQGSAEKLLNCWQQHHFSAEFAHAVLVFRKVARCVPLQRGGDQFACSFSYELRSRDDPRFKDRRMQGLLSFLHERLAEASPADIAALCKCLPLLLLT